MITAAEARACVDQSDVVAQQDADPIQTARQCAEAFCAMLDVDIRAMMGSERRWVSRVLDTLDVSHDRDLILDNAKLMIESMLRSLGYEVTTTRLLIYDAAQVRRACTITVMW